jgi:hypothetical protein
MLWSFRCVAGRGESERRPVQGRTGWKKSSFEAGNREVFLEGL